MIGLTVGSLYCAWLVGMKHELSVGDYVLFGTYILQLYGPLNFFGTYYRLIQQAFVDMENMLDLFDIQPDVQDSPHATDLVINNGMIEFENVCFHYQSERPILKNVSFSILPGQTLAIVGPTGSGRVRSRAIPASLIRLFLQERAPSSVCSSVSTMCTAAQSKSTERTSQL